MIDSKSDALGSKRTIIFILLVLLWAFGPSILSFTDLDFTIALLAWILQYSYLGSTLSYSFIMPFSVGIILNLPRFLFILYVVQSFGKTTKLKTLISFGILVELPLILGAVYYGLIPPGVYSYYLTIPVPIIVVVGILLLMWKPRIRA